MRFHLMCLLVMGLGFILVTGLRADIHRIKGSFLHLQKQVCQSSAINIHRYFDYSRIKEAWFAGADLPDEECNDRIKAFRNAVQNWASLGQGSPFCRFSIENHQGSRLRLKFGYMYSYLDGDWAMDWRNGQAVVVSLPRPPEPPPYGCGIPD